MPTFSDLSSSPAPKHRHGALGAAVACLLAASALPAQCAQWAAYGSGANNSVFSVAAAGNGDVLCGGVFTQAGGAPASRIARWNGTTWNALGSGVDNGVRAIVELPNGDLVAAGDFALAGGVAASRIARWDGSAWHALGSGVSSPSLFGLYAVAAMPNGDVIAGGYFQSAGGVPASAIARWDGTSWAPLGSGIPTTVFALTVLQNGDLIVGGNFGTAGGVTCSRIARWNGTTWSPLGSGMTGFRVNAVVELPNGDLVAGGAFTAAGGTPAANIARWNGSTWAPLGAGCNGDVLALQTLPNGELLAGGQFSTAGGAPALAMARWNGSSWAAMGFSGFGEIYGLATAANGDRVAGGAFFNAGGVPAAFVARYQSTCPATAIDTAAGCPGSGGANQFAATEQPWIGSTYRAHGSGLPAFALAAVVSGFATVNLPLAPLLPPSPAACSLLVAPDLLDVAVPSGGELDTQVAIPNSPGLVGIVLHQQLVLFELDPQTFATIENTVSNRLSATVGSF